MLDSPRQGLGSLFRSILDFTAARGLTAEVRARVSPAVQALVDKPPRPLSFMPSAPIDEVEHALLQLTSPEVLVECGLSCSRSMGWTLVQPVLRAVFVLFGQSAAPVFARLDSFFSVLTKGIRFDWSAGEGGGTLLARFDGPGTPEAAFHVLRGSLLFIFEVSGTVGEVGTPEVVEATPAGTTVRYQVQCR